jgi:TetR/AcrR family transcriptional regulator, lmrAB and yxaGH operons repressor
MIKAGRRLYSVRGYADTAFSDVLAESGAPRGSVYFHFPGGKDEFAAEVVAAHRRSEEVRLAKLAAACKTPRELVVAFLTAARDYAVSTGFREGCPIGVVILESSHTSPALFQSTAAAVEASIDSFATLLVERGATEPNGRRWATAAITGYEGALIIARAMKDPAPFDSLIELIQLAMDRECASTA